MTKPKSIDKHHRFPPEIIQYAVWLYYKLNLSHRDIEDLLAERGITVTHESIRLWCNMFGPRYARRLKRRHHGFGDTFFLDEVFVKIQGVQHYLWRVVDQDGEVADVFVQTRRAQSFLNAHAMVYNLFNLGRHLVTADHYRDLRQDAFLSWEKVTVA